MKTPIKKIRFISFDAKRRCEQGQAVTEYVLILLVTVALLVSLSLIMFKPFSKWLENYMGAYLQCLLDAGELPSLGYENDGSVCNDDYQPLTAFGGRPPKSESEKNASKASKEGDSNKDRSPSTSSESRAGSSRRSKGFDVGESGASNVANGKKEGDQSAAENNSKSKTYRNFTSSSARSSQSRVIVIQGGLPSMAQVNRTQKKDRVSSVPNEQGEEARKKSRAFVVKKTERKPAAEDEAPWDFSQYLKFFLMIAIIIAIVFFVTMQLRQVFKSGEK